MEVLVVVHRDIKINAIVVGIMVFLVVGIGHLKRKFVTSNGVTNEDKKRKAKSLEPALGSEQHPNPMLSHLALNSGHENPNLGDEETSQANSTTHEVCIDGWTITYKDFQPRRINQVRKKASQLETNLQSQRADNTPSNTSVENDITKDPAKKK